MFEAVLLTSILLTGDVDFDRDVKPILSDRCFACHGPDAGSREAGLRLDTREGAIAKAIAPGDSAGSLLLERIRHADASMRMPPPSSKRSLSDDEIDVIARWIDAGAEYETHWSFVPPERHDVPQVGAWARDDLDRFVAARLAEEGLEPLGDASRESLLRRATLTLTGLPPSIDELDAFLADEADGAYERAVDRLLASPRFGERMAMDWLDVARYADTYGYQNDVAREVWPYRDWVIGAFNENLPYDDFITWQLAGDLLPNATREQKLATTFNRLHRQTNEGGSVEAEYLVEYAADRTHTFGTAFLGLTLECARCHDHKFDPISQREYYELLAFFNSIDEAGMYSHFTNAVPTPALLLTTPEQDEELERLRAAVVDAEARVDRGADLGHWIEPGGLVASYSLDDAAEGIENTVDESKPGRVDAVSFAPGHTGGAVVLGGDDTISFPGVAAFGRADPFTLAFYLKVPREYDRAVVIHRSRAWTDAASQGYQLLIVDGKLEAALIHFWPGDAIAVQAMDPLPIDRWLHVAMSYDGSSRAKGLSLYVNGALIATRVVRDELTGSITGGGGQLALGQRFRDIGLAGGMIDELRVYDRAVGATDDEALHAARRELASALDRVRRIMTMRELETPRPTFVLDRGRYDAPAAEVGRATPAQLGPLPADAPRDRLGLAQWLTDPAHPMAARVAVNRLWQLVFGAGLVATPEDFGIQGMRPSHPELLDVLALDFIESGWDVKAMLRRFVTSATYRQSTRVDESRRIIDPDNVLLSRGPGGRLSAEMLRDQALLASEMLHEKLGGPSVRPYQPAGLWQEKSGAVYRQSAGADLYRRSLYTYWKRTSPPPAMMIFDASKRDVCVARRQATSTPLQALVLMNDPQFVEAARVLAERVLGTPRSDEALIDAIMRRLTSRSPDEREREVLMRMLASQRAVFADDPEAAAAIRTVGERAPDESLDDVEVAAWTIIASTVMNHDAAVNRR